MTNKEKFATSVPLYRIDRNISGADEFGESVTEYLRSINYKNLDRTLQEVASQSIYANAGDNKEYIEVAMLALQSAVN